MTWAIERRIFVDDPFLQPCYRRDDLISRARGVLSLNGLILHGTELVGRKSIPCVKRHALNKSIGIKSRPADDSQDMTTGGLYGYSRPYLASKHFFCFRLKFNVQRQVDIFS